MHGGQAIPAFDFMLAPYVRMTWKEELKYFSDLISGVDLSCYNDIEIKDYEDEFVCQNPDNMLDDAICKLMNQARKRTIHRVHQAMESFIHNMNTIHSRGGNQVA